MTKIKVDKYTIKRSTCHDGKLAIWISHSNGEGMQISVEEFRDLMEASIKEAESALEKVVDRFYKGRF